MPVGREHRDARDLVGHVDGAGRVDVDVHRMIEIAPLAVVVAFRAEQLDPVVLAIGDQDAVPRVDPDPVGRCELAPPCARRAPRLEVLSVRGEPVDRGVAIAVGDVDLTGGGDGHVGRVVEGRLERRPAAVSQRQDDAALRRDLQNLVLVPVAEIEMVVSADEDPVRVA